MHTSRPIIVGTGSIVSGIQVSSNQDDIFRVSFSFNTLSSKLLHLIQAMQFDHFGRDPFYWCSGGGASGICIQLKKTIFGKLK